MGRKKKHKKPPAQSASWYANKRPVIFFGLKFCAVLSVLCLLSLAPHFQRAVADLSVVDARIARAILRVLGEETDVTNATLHSERLWMESDRPSDRLDSCGSSSLETEAAGIVLWVAHGTGLHRFVADLLCLV